MININTLPRVRLKNLPSACDCDPPAVTVMPIPSYIPNRVMARCDVCNAEVLDGILTSSRPGQILSIDRIIWDLLVMYQPGSFRASR